MRKFVFWNHLFCKTRTAYVYKISYARLYVQDFATGKNFSFNQCHNKEFCIFLGESLFIKVIKNQLFPYICFIIAWYKHERGWENSQLLWLRLGFAYKLSWILPIPLVFISGYVFRLLVASSFAKEVTDFSNKSSRHVSLVICAYWSPYEIWN